MTKKTTMSTADKTKVGTAAAVVVLAMAFAAYTLWGGPRPGEAEPPTAAPPEAAAAPATEPAAKPGSAPATTAAPAEKPNPHKVGGRMVPTDAKPGGN